MIATRSLAAALALGSALGISCYSEPLPPSTYRYACEADDDCTANEACRQGRCERPCTQLTSAEDCPQAEGFVACFNGACASPCAVGSKYCPSNQECIDLGLDLSGGSSNPFGGGSDATIGICGIKCDAGDNADLCPEGEVCIAEFGSCAIDCSQGQECPGGYACIFGVCAPESVLPMDDGGSSMATSTDDGGSDTMGATDDGGSSSMGAEPADDEDRR
jgi:hypothetical protein